MHPIERQGSGERGYEPRRIRQVLPHRPKRLSRSIRGCIQTPLGTIICRTYPIVNGIHTAARAAAFAIVRAGHVEDAVAVPAAI
jgi:hypothetical protein